MPAPGKKSDTMTSNLWTSFSSQLKRPQTLLVLAVLITMAASGIYAMRVTGISPSDLKTLSDQIIESIADYPLLAFLAVLFVAGLPLPLSPFLVLAGALYTHRYGLPTALLLCYSAMVLGMVWTYFVSAYPLHSLCQRVVALFSRKLPEIPEEHKSKVALIIRITPGIPFFVQNYFLGVSKVPFWKYLFIGMAVQALYTPGFVIGGGAIFEGKLGLALGAIALIIVMGITIHWLRSRMANKLKPVPESPDPSHSTPSL